MFGWLTGNGYNPDNDIPSLDGKVILVTGGNIGLGRETVLQLAKHNPKEIFLAARTQSKAEAAIQEIKKIVPNAPVSFLQLNLGSLADVKKGADEFNSRSDRLDLLINNAGIMAVPFELTKDGYEIQFGTNHVGHALLTRLLLPTLLQTAEKPDSDVRVINVSSEGNAIAPSQGIIYDQAALEKFSTLRRYGQSKVANIHHARELQRRYPVLTATAIHPGAVDTNLTHHFKGPLAWMVAIMKRGVKTVEEGAKSQLWAATADKETVRSSYYWVPVGSKNKGGTQAQNEQQGKTLWEWTEKELDEKGY